jgi:type I restriction enzyme S subunit
MNQKISQYIEILSGFPFDSELFNNKSNGLPLIRIRDLERSYSETFFSGDYDSTYVIVKDDILIGMDGDFNVVKWKGINSLLNQRICKIKTKNELDKEFLFQSLQSKLDNIHRKTAATTVKHLSVKDIKQIKIFFPSLNEQKKIANILSTVDEKIALIDNQIEETETLKKGLMQKLLTEGIGHGEFKDSEIGRIPVGWGVVRLENLLTFKNGINASKEQYGRGYKFINVLDIINNLTINYKNIIGNVEIPKEEFLNNEVFYGDILFQRSSETREEVGQSNIYLDKEKSCTFGGFVIRGRAIQDYNPVFMNYLFKIPIIRKQITSRSGGSTRYNIGQKGLNQVVVPLPPLKEQKQIAEILSTTDDKLEILRDKKESFQKLKKGLMQKLLTGEIRVRV